jgi:hypothetical protein
MAPDPAATTAEQAGSRLIRYAVVDLASAPALAEAVASLRPPQAETLFLPEMPARLLQAGPWLVDLGRTPEVAAALAGLGPRVPWGYYLHADVDLMWLRLGLRKFYLACMPGFARPVLFRYWDPRVLRDFMAVATSAQRRQFMEWILRIEAADGSFDFRQKAED